MFLVKKVCLVVDNNITAIYADNKIKNIPNYVQHLVLSNPLRVVPNMDFFFIKRSHHGPTYSHHIYVLFMIGIHSYLIMSSPRHL